MVSAPDKMRAVEEWWIKSANGSDVSKRAIIDGNSVISGRNYVILTSIIAQLLTSRPFPDLCRRGLSGSQG